MQLSGVLENYKGGAGRCGIRGNDGKRGIGGTHNTVGQAVFAITPTAMHPHRTKQACAVRHTE